MIFNRRNSESCRGLLSRVSPLSNFQTAQLVILTDGGKEFPDFDGRIGVVFAVFEHTFA
jgi:hypothetical protein